MKRFAMAMLGAAVLAGPAAALGPVGFGPDPAAAGWEELTFRGLKANRFTATGAGLRVETSDSVSVLWKRLPRSFAPGRTAAWRWRVDTSVPPTDLARKNADDRNLAVYFVFADDPATLDNPPQSLRAALRRGRALIYTWGGNAAPGTIITNPGLLGRAKTVIRKTAAAPTGQWDSETVDLHADFRRAFGQAPGPLMGVGVSGDSDTTGTASAATLSGLAIR